MTTLFVVTCGMDVRDQTRLSFVTSFGPICDRSCKFVRAQKPEHTTATPSEPSLSRGRRVSKERSIQGESNHGAILRRPCRYCLQGTCTRSPCEYWHPPECQFFLTESGCKAGDKCLFPHCGVEEHPSKKAEDELSKRKKRRQGCCSCCENCTTVGLCLARLRAITTSKRRQVSGKPEAECFGINRKVRFTQSTLRQASIRDKKGPSLGKIQVSEVPAL